MPLMINVAALVLNVNNLTANVPCVFVSDG